MRPYRRITTLAIAWLLPALSLGLLALLPAARAAESATLTISQVDDSAFPEVVAYVTLADATGRPIPGVPASDFAAAEDGQPVAGLGAQSVVNQQRGVTLVLALDVSGSMKGAALAATQEAARALVSGLGPQDRAAILAFSDQVTWVQDFTADPALLAQAIDGLKAGGETAFNDALHDAASHIAGLPPGRRAILILTDGEDTASGLGLDAAVAKAQAHDAPVYAVGFGARVKPDLLQEVAKLTGGQYFHVPQATDLASSFQSILEQLKQQYVLSYRSALVPDMKEHELRVRVTYAQDVLEGSHHFLARAVTPVIAVPGIAEGDLLRGRVLLQPAIVSATPLSQTLYLLDGVLLAEAAAPAYDLAWDTATVTPGEHTLALQATNAEGLTSAWQVAVTVAPPLEVRFASPKSGDRIGGQVTLAAKWEAAYDLVEVSYWLDGSPLESTTAAPYQVLWRTSQVPTGTHELAVEARDVEDNSARSSIEVSVVPAVAVEVTAPRPGELVSGIVGISAVVDAMSGLSRVELWVNNQLESTLPGSDASTRYDFTWDSSPVQPGEYTLTVKAFDLTGESGERLVNVRVPMPKQSLDRAWLWVLLGGGLVFALLVALIAWWRVRSARKVRPRQPSGVAASLAWHDPEEGTKRFPLHEGDNTVGRAADNQIVMPRATVSRHHAVITIRGSTYTITNLSERSSLTLDGLPVTGTQALQAGIPIQLGDEACVLEEESR